MLRWYKGAYKVRGTGKQGVQVHHRDAARGYDGGHRTSNQFVKTAVSMACRLLPNAVAQLGNICHGKLPDFVLRDGSHNECGFQLSNEVIKMHRFWRVQ